MCVRTGVMGTAHRNIAEESIPGAIFAMNLSKDLGND